MRIEPQVNLPASPRRGQASRALPLNSSLKAFFATRGAGVLPLLPMGGLPDLSARNDTISQRSPSSQPAS